MEKTQPIHTEIPISVPSETSQETGGFGKVLQKRKKNPFVWTLPSPSHWIKQAAAVAFAFLCGRVCFFGFLNPLPFAVCAAFMERGRLFYLTLAASCAGLVFSGANLLLAKYIGGLLLLALLHITMAKRLGGFTAREKAI